MTWLVAFLLTPLALLLAYAIWWRWRLEIWLWESDGEPKYLEDESAIYFGANHLAIWHMDSDWWCCVTNRFRNQPGPWCDPGGSRSARGLTLREFLRMTGKRGWIAAWEDFLRRHDRGSVHDAAQDPPKRKMRPIRFEGEPCGEAERAPQPN